MVKTEETDAVGNLFADSVKAGQIVHGLGIGHGGQGIQVQAAQDSVLTELMDIFGPVSQLQIPQFLQAGPGEFLGRGEGEGLHVPGIGDGGSIAAAQSFYQLPDGGNGFLLGDDKGQDHFPGVLTQDPDAAGAGSRPGNIGVFRVGRMADGDIIGGTVKIIQPEIQVIVLTLKGNVLVVLADEKQTTAADVKK